MKRRGEEYKLFWRDDRPDFVRLAAKYDALIVPFAAVGADDAYKLFLVKIWWQSLNSRLRVRNKPVLGPLARHSAGTDSNNQKLRIHEASEPVQDTDEILAAPVLGPLVRRAVAAIDPSLDPAETVLPVATLPGSSRLPSPFPVPDVRKRIYFRSGRWQAICKNSNQSKITSSTPAWNQRKRFCRLPGSSCLPSPCPVSDVRKRIDFR